MTSIDDLFKGRHFDREIIILCVRWYLWFKLSLRDLVEMMAERGIDLARTTVMRWIARYAESDGTASHAELAGHGGSTKLT
jgi:transposase-like protein